MPCWGVLPQMRGLPAGPAILAVERRGKDQNALAKAFQAPPCRIAGLPGKPRLCCSRPEGAACLTEHHCCTTGAQKPLHSDARETCTACKCQHAGHGSTGAGPSKLSAHAAAGSSDLCPLMPLQQVHRDKLVLQVCSLGSASMQCRHSAAAGLRKLHPTRVAPTSSACRRQSMCDASRLALTARLQSCRAT